jgi:8-oxo-dGTP diphosphatase
MDEKYLFVVAQKALIKRDGKYLVLKRSSNNKSFIGYWELPGGKLELGEEPKEGLKREVKEETNLEINVNSPIFVYLETAKINAYVTIFDCDFVSGEIKLSFEHSDYKWATKEELLEMKLEPRLKDYLKNKK